VEKKDRLKEKNDFLKDAYQLRIQFYSDHTSRMWTRFNFLLTAEIGVLGFLITKWADPLWQEKLWLFPSAGIFISLIWYILGAQDRYYFEGFRNQIQYLEKQISKELGIEDLHRFAFGNPTDVKQGAFTWRWKFISLSRLVAAFPIFFLIAWLITLGFMLKM
jgi:hypothetical protein